MDKVWFLLSTLLIASLLSQSPRFFVDGRTVRSRDVATTTMDNLVEVDPQVTDATPSDPTTTTETLKTLTNVKTTPKSITEATTVINERAHPTLLDSER